MSQNSSDWIQYIVGHPAVAGLMGAVVGLKFAPGATWKERAFNMFCGVALAWNLAVPIVEYFDLPVEKFSGAIGFMLGLAGMHIISAAMERVSTDGLKGLVTWITGR